MITPGDITAYATLSAAVLSGVASIITAWRTNRVEKRQLMDSEKLDQHDTKLSDVAAIAAHTAESIDNHIADESPLIAQQKAMLAKERHDGGN